MLDFFVLDTRLPAFLYKEEQPWFPLSLAVDAWDADFHQLLCSDRIRVQAYKSAVHAAIFTSLQNSKQRNHLRIVDVGTGSGILSHWAIECWKKNYSAGQTNCSLEIIALESNSRTATLANEQLSRHWHDIPPLMDSKLSIKTIPASSYEVCACPGQHDLESASVDIVLCEMMGNIVDNEDITSVLCDVSQSLLSTEGTIVPIRLDQYLVPISSQHLWEAVERKQIQTLNANFRHKFESLVTGQKLPYYDAIIPSRCHIDQPKLVRSFDFRAPDLVSQKYDVDLSFVADRDVEMHGFKSFFLAELSGGVLLNTGGSPTGFGIPQHSEHKAGWDYSRRSVSDCWKHGFIALNRPIFVKKGSTVSFCFSRCVDDLKMVYRIAGNVGPRRFEQTITFPRPLANIIPDSAPDLTRTFDGDWSVSSLLPS